MAIITSGKIFTNGEQLTADKMNQMFTSASFDTAGAVDASTLQVLTDGSLSVKDGGVATAKIADSAVTSAKLNLTDGATIAKSGASEVIASFTTTQDGSNRGLFIQTPDSATDLDSPFILNTGNAISFEVDNTEAIRIDSSRRLLIFNIPTSASGLSSGTVYSDSGTLKIVS